MIHQHLLSDPCGGELVPYYTDTRWVTTNRQRERLNTPEEVPGTDLLWRCVKCGLTGYPATSGVAAGK